MRLTCDIFCTVVDNFGDIGMCWRLAKQLAHEHGITVRLWVDNLESFHKLCAEVEPNRALQHCQGIAIHQWPHTDITTDITTSHLTNPAQDAGQVIGYSHSTRLLKDNNQVAGYAEALRDVHPAQVVIETFACQLPEKYITAMAAMPHKPVWINLEHLSAEQWVGDYHGLPSPHPTLPLVKHYFFPGFTSATGGLLIEKNLMARRDAFQGDFRAQIAMWQALDIPSAQPSAPQGDNEIRVSLFCYENAVLPALFTEWENSTVPILCLVPEGRILPQVAAHFKYDEMAVGTLATRGNLRVKILPFMEQARYDELLWACDINFVRGEDSLVRALWAGKPCVWHIYPQHDFVHLQQLHALMNLYCTNLPAGAAASVLEFWDSWNAPQGDNVPQGDNEAHNVHHQKNMNAAWQNYLKHRLILQQHGHDWAEKLKPHNLVLNLLNFIRNTDRMRALRD